MTDAGIAVVGIAVAAGAYWVWKERQKNGAKAAAPANMADSSGKLDPKLVLAEYAKVLGRVAGQELADDGLLPVPKSKLRALLLLLVSKGEAGKGRDAMAAAYLQLSMFQPGVSKLAPVPDAATVAKEQDPAKLVRYAELLSGGGRVELMDASMREMQELQADLHRIGAA